MEKIALNQFVVKEFYAAEALRTLRTNILFSGSDVKTIALTSAGVSEGKSTISFQLAAFLAHTGKRVLLVDGDLRNSVLKTRLQVKGPVDGLAHVLSGLTGAQDAILETDLPNMFVMFAGAKAPNSAELLGAKSFKTLMDALKKVFDYVIIDSAPLGLVIDCAMIASVVDGVVIVIDTTHNSHKLIRRMKTQLEKAGGKILGVILNRVNIKDVGGYYNKAYGYDTQN